MTQLRTSCKQKFWLNKTITCFEFASCISRVIALDKEISSKAEIVKEMTIKQKKEKKMHKKTTDHHRASDSKAAPFLSQETS